MKYYIVEVGDDPDDETCLGPFNSIAYALRSLSDAQYTYYIFDKPVNWVGPNIRGWHGPLGSLYLVGHEGGEKPIWKKDILPILKSVKTGKIKRQYDEE